ncbi:MAG: menaquinone biosynthesis decarboxylase, partial [Armatimonadota bacterium]
LAIVSIRKSYPGQARKVMHALWGAGQLMFTKVIVVVDEDVDVHDTGNVTWRALNAIDPKRDVVFGEGPVDALDHAARDPFVGSKMGIDATDKWPEELDGRQWPDQIRSDPEAKARVDALWERLGLDAQ